jgi:uncharacterized protein DUF6916
MELSIAFFQPLVGQEFDARIEGDPRICRLVLLEVEVLTPPKTTRKIRKDPFSLIFSGGLPGLVAHRTASVSRAGHDGSLLLFFEPLSFIEGVVEYQAIVA